MYNAQIITFTNNSVVIINVYAVCVCFLFGLLLFSKPFNTQEFFLCFG